MPKYGVHHVVLNNTITKLGLSSNTAAQQANGILTQYRDYAMLGAVGPDLFFWAPDYEPVKFLYKFYTNIEDVVDLYNKVVQPIQNIQDTVKEPVEDIIETLAPSTVKLISQLIEEIRDTAKQFKRTVDTGLFAGVLTGLNLVSSLAELPSLSADFFDSFRPPLQDGEPESNWYWFDMLHYRNTGQFAKALVDNARTEKQIAYALGYLSHIATDLVGHAYVNQVVGGPYRLHVQRHVTVENFMDCWSFQKYYGKSINLSLLDQLNLPNPDELSDEIIALLDRSFFDTYGSDGVVHPKRLPGNGFLTKSDIRQTYDFFYKVLQIIKKVAITRPEEPFSGVTDILKGALGDLLEPPPTPPSFHGGNCSLGDIFSLGLTQKSRDCYEDFVSQIATWLEYVGELLIWTIETMLDLIDLLLTSLLSLSVTVLLAILYELQLLLYQFYQSMRWVLALEGFIYPEPDDLNNSIGRNLTTTFHCSVESNFDDYPRWKNLAISHLECPPGPFESPETAANFQPSSSQITPDTFINSTTFSLDNLISYAKCSLPRDTRDLQRDQVQIGNAVDLTKFMIVTAIDNNASGDLKEVAFTNWNLDSDRGYGYKTWNADIYPNESYVGEERYV